MTPRLRAAAAFVFLASLSTPALAWAHRGSAKSIVVEPTDEGALVRVEVELVDAAVELGLGEDASVAAVLAERARVLAWLASGVRVHSPDRVCEARASDDVALVDGSPPRLAVSIEHRCGLARPLRLEDRTVFPSDPQHEAYVRLRFGEGMETAVLRRGRQEVELGAPASVLSLLGTFAREGVVHLVTGYDHLLFLLSLLLTAGERARDQGRARALRDVALVVTAFTLGHSVTLVAAALGWVVLPARLVESVIAASIVLVSALNFLRPGPEARSGMPWIALGFGLVHGFGFSSVLAEIGLPTRARVLSLLAFNVGIELAQLAAVLVAIGPLAWLARRPGYRTYVVRGGSIAIGALASLWLVERALG